MKKLNLTLTNETRKTIGKVFKEDETLTFTQLTESRAMLFNNTHSVEFDLRCNTEFVGKKFKIDKNILIDNSITIADDIIETQTYNYFDNISLDRIKRMTTLAFDKKSLNNISRCIKANDSRVNVVIFDPEYYQIALGDFLYMRPTKYKLNGKFNIDYQEKYNINFERFSIETKILTKLYQLGKIISIELPMNTDNNEVLVEITNNNDIITTHIPINFKTVDLSNIEFGFDYNNLNEKYTENISNIDIDYDLEDGIELTHRLNYSTNKGWHTSYTTNDKQENTSSKQVHTRLIIRNIKPLLKSFNTIGVIENKNVKNTIGIDLALFRNDKYHVICFPCR